MEVKRGYKQTEVGVIPKEWDVKPLKGRVSIAHGFAFASQYFASNGNYRLTTPGHFYEEGGFRDIGDRQKYYTGPVPSDYVLRPGDMIVAMTEQADGLLGSAAVIPTVAGYLHNQRLGSVKALTPDVHLPYLFWVFNSSGYRSKVRETAAGTKVKHTSPEKLLEISVRLPPEPEQRAIAEALSDVDGLLGGLNRLIAKKRDLKHAAMQQLLTGRTRLPRLSGKWEARRLDAVATISMGQSPDSKNYNRKGDGVPLIQGNADIEGRLSIARVWTTQITKEGCLGDLLLTVRAPVGAVGRISERSCLGRGVCSLKPNGDAGFLFHALVFAESAWKVLEQGSTFTSANSTQVAAFRIWMPADLSEQTAIAEVLTDMDTELAALEQRREKTRALKQAMMQELLTGRTRLVQAEAAYA